MMAARAAMTRLIPIVLVGLAWEAFAQSGAVTPFMLPPLSAVASRIWSDAGTGDLALNAGLTLYRALAGFLIAAAAGVALGCAMSRSALMRWFFDPVISVGCPRSRSCRS
jgi:ABC-type nitrate/sulfonate/bicarbonate transport system permease component